MSTTIKLKNSVVKDKVPLPSGLEIGELAVGAHSESPALFFKDNADNIIKIEPGAGAESSPTPPIDPGTGDLWFDTDNDTLNYWDGSAWVELGEAGDSPVKSVNTKTGAVVLDASDVGALPTVGGDLTGSVTSTSTITTQDSITAAWNINTTGGKTQLGAYGQLYIEAANPAAIDVRSVDDTAISVVRFDKDGSGTFVGDVTADKFIGDGSLLTNLPNGGAVDSVNGQTGVVSIGVEELDDFAYYPASEQVTLLGPCVGSAGTFSGTEYISGSGSNLYFGFPKSNTQVYDVLSQLTDGDAVTVCFYSSTLGNPYTEVETTFSSISNNGGTVPSWLVQFNDAVPGAVIGNYPVVFKSAFITNGQAPITTGQVLVYDQITEKWRPEDIGGGVVIGDTPPANPQAGDEWWSTKDGENTLYIYYDDGVTSQWVIAVPTSSGGGGGGGDYLPLTGGDLTGRTNIGSDGTPIVGPALYGVCNVDEAARAAANFRNTGTGPALICRTAAGNDGFRVESNGSINAAGEIKVEGTNTPGGLWSGISKYGSLLIGTSSEAVGDAKVSIDSGSGSITAAGNITSGNLIKGDYFQVTKANGNYCDIGASDTQLITIKDASNAKNVILNASGSATFAGRVIGGSTDFGPTAVSTEAGLFYNNSSGQYPAVLARNMGGGTNFRGVNSVGTTTIDLNSGGDANFTGTVTATVVPPSDARFKENIEPAKPQLADVVALGGLLKNYDWNDDAPVNEELRSQRQLGLIAQEAAEVCPAIVKDIHRTKTVEVKPAVTGPKGRVITEAVTKEEDDSYKGISTDALIMKLIGAVTELTARVAELEEA